MSRLRFWGLIPAFCLLALPSSVQGANELKLGTGEAKINNGIEIPLTLTTTDQVQGLVAAFHWDGSKGVGDAFVAGPALLAADTVVRRIEADYMVLGVVMDSDGLDGEVIDPGTDLLLATATIQCTAVESADVPIEFADNAYATVDGGPLLENIVVVGGLSIGQVEGLVLTPGKFGCFGVRNQFYIDPASDAKTARVLMDSTAAVEGYVVALCSEAADLTLDSIAVGSAAVAQAADFSQAETFANGGTLGVVIDLLAPYTNNTIPAGEGRAIAVFSYTCVAASGSFPVTFCNNQLGDPLKENVMVIGGLSVDPILIDGAVVCPPPCVPVPEVCTNGIDDDCDGKVDAADEDCQTVPVEDCNNGVDDDGDGLVDQDDPDCKQAFACGPRGDGGPGVIDASLGETTEVCFSLLNPEDNRPGVPQFDHIQGFSMALSFCCDIEVVEETLDISGTILEALGAEYVKVDADNDPNDGDGCELIIGVLIDALPPFDGATIPPADGYIPVGCVTFRVKDGATCGRLCNITFDDGVNGSGKIPINNLISVENFSKPVTLQSCGIQIVDVERFFRGDCNFSADSDPNGGSLAVDIADAAAVVSYLFLPWEYKFDPPCLDACDCNDDGRIDLADAVCILRYLFQNGRFPPAPGPGFRETGLPNPDGVVPTGPGVDPTPDLLDCKAGDSC